MITDSNLEVSPPKRAAEPSIFTAGTLRYTRAGLFTLFAWLLWGDFVFTLMESVVPSLLPLLLKSNGANNREIIVIVSTLSMVFNSALNPVISYQSDRFRSRWGRRRPFILVTTPFVMLFLAAIPFAPEILHHIEMVGAFNRLLSLSPVAPLMLTFGVLVAGFQVFNMFVASVYYYLIPDTVPQEFIGRFFGLFRLFGTLASIVFNYFIFGHAEHNMRAIFVLVALFYGFFIILMCLRVKEGVYPPPLKESHGFWWSGIYNYAEECYGHSYYWWVFLTYSALGWGGTGSVFAVFYYQSELGLSLDLIGKMTAWSGIAFVILCYPFGILIDRWGCQKTLILGTALVLISSVLMFFLAIDARSGVIWTILRSLMMALSGMAMMKWTVEVYPHDRYGQFGSAGALFSSIGGIAASFVYGWWMDWVKMYRYFLIWHALFAVIGLVAAIKVYQQWKKLGGPDNYCPP